jgi:hypothetical protein
MNSSISNSQNGKSSDIVLTMLFTEEKGMSIFEKDSES